MVASDRNNRLALGGMRREAGYLVGVGDWWQGTGMRPVPMTYRSSLLVLLRPARGWLDRLRGLGCALPTRPIPFGLPILVSPPFLRLGSRRCLRRCLLVGYGLAGFRRLVCGEL